MTTAIQGTQAPAVFSFNSLSIRAITDDQGAPWFVASDVCSILGYRNCGRTITDHCREAGIRKRYIRSNGQNRQVTLIDEGNLYRLIIKSKKPEAEKFESLVMEEILPAIRKTGSYSKGYRPLPPQPDRPAKRYDYPRALLEQDGFTAKDRPARLDISMLANRKFVSPLFHLLNELRVNRHDVSAVLDEAEAMREAIVRSDEAFSEILEIALRAQNRSSSKAGKSS